jgi:hypothetical protein
MSRADNKKLGGVAPSVYRQFMPENPQDILIAGYIDKTKLFADDYNEFIGNRASKLFSAVNDLIN